MTKEIKSAIRSMQRHMVWHSSGLVKFLLQPISYNMKKFRDFEEIHNFFPIVISVDTGALQDYRRQRDTSPQREATI